MLSRHPSLTLLNFFMLLFALTAVLGVLAAYDPSLSLGALSAIFASVALYFLMAHLPRSHAALYRIGSLTLLVAILFGLYFITQYGYQDYPEKGGIIARLGQLTTLLPNLNGFTPHLNAAATFLEAAAPLGLALVAMSRTRAHRIAFGLGALVVLYAVFLTASRGAWLALAATSGVALALVVLARLPHRLANILVGLGVAAIAVGLLAVFALGPDRLPFLSSTFSRASDRGLLFQNSLRLAGDYAFTGAGLGDTFAMVYARYSLLIFVPYLTYPHNLPLSVWLNQGLLGLIALGGIVATFYRFVNHTRRQAQPSPLFHGAWLGVTATLLHGLTDAPQYADSHWVMPMLFVCMGLAIASGRLALRDVPQTPITNLSNPFVSKRLIVIGAVAAIALIALFNRPIRAAWYTNLGALEETRGELAPDLADAQRDAHFASATASYQNALAIDPDGSNAQRRLGNLLIGLDRFEEAAPLLEAAFKRESPYQATVKGLGLAYVWLGRTEEAARVFFALDDLGAMAEELMTWGSYHSEQSRPLLAAHAYQTVYAMYPDSDNLDVWFAIADNYLAAGQVEAARLWYNRVLELEPGNERARQALGAMDE
ncbi:MAG TPA: tetratricopeptide repeat protein [Anaerolineae bacterium]|nr:tetratricopeptide repeat protein [Anaerolineae bacterium]